MGEDDEPMIMNDDQTPTQITDNRVDENSDFVPDVLLALAKDKRYLNQLSTLISKCIHVSEDERVQSFSDLNPEINLLARFISVLYLLREKKTLGMGYMGVRYEDITSAALVSFGMMFSFLPYLIERAGTNGWGELKKNISVLLGKSARNDRSVNDRDRLKGEERRKMFEESRKKMLEGVITKQSTHVSQTHRDMKQKHYFHVFRKIMQTIAMLDMSFPVAFEVTSSNGPPVSQNRHLHSNICSRVGLGNTLKWIIRFHAALFYVSGKYPTFFHRFSGLKMKKLPLADTLVTQRPEFKIIGLLVLTQLGAALVVQFTKASIQMILSFMNESKNLNDEIEIAVPSSVSDDISSTRRLVSSQQEMNCGICAHPRRFPAAPIGCGHVFCWTCLQHFVSQVRPQCPLCRRKTSPQEILRLHNY